MSVWLVENGGCDGICHMCCTVYPTCQGQICGTCGDDGDGGEMDVGEARSMLEGSNEASVGLSTAVLMWGLPLFS